MSGRMDIQLALKVAKMEGDMHALHSEVKASLDGLRVEIAQRETERDTRYEKELRNRDRWLYGLLISVLVALVFLLVRPYVKPVFDAVATSVP